MKKIWIFASIIGALWRTGVAEAAPFSITDRTTGLDATVPGNAAIIAGFNAAADAMENMLNSQLFADTNRRTFNDGLAKGSVSEMSSLMMDRASNPGYFTISAGGQVSYYSADGGFSTTAQNSLPHVGIGAAANLTVGIRPSKIGFGKGIADRMMIFLSGMGVSTRISNIDFKLLDLGVNVQYQLIPPKRAALLVNWGGLNLGTGFNLASNSVSYKANFNQSTTISVSGQSATVNADLDYSLGMRTKVYTIPLEISSNITFLGFLTFYGGGGADINFGSSALTGGAKGPISATYSGSIGTAVPFAANASLDLDDEAVAGKPPLIVGRGFGGVQLNIAVLKIAGEFSILTSGSRSGAVIVRIAL